MKFTPPEYAVYQEEMREIRRLEREKERRKRATIRLHTYLIEVNGKLKIKRKAYFG